MLLLQQSGWQDSNLRPPGPKPGALAKLSHTPLFFFIYLCFVVRRKTYYMVSHPKCQHFFSIFFVFFWKSDFFGFKKCRKAAKIKALLAFHFFEKSFIFLLEKWFVAWFLRFFVKKYFFRTIKKSQFFILDVFINEQTQNILCSQLWGHYVNYVLTWLKSRASRRFRRQTKYRRIRL